MEQKVCFLFGHGDAPEELVPQIVDAARRFYLEHNIRTFVTGSRGNFDRLAARAIGLLKQEFTDITALLLLAYHPAERKTEPPRGFDGSFYPPLEGVPRPYAIVRANRYMADTCDGVICYVKHPGNTRKLLTAVQKRQVNTQFPVENLAG